MIGIVYLGPLGSIAGKKTSPYRPGYYYITADKKNIELKWNTADDKNLSTLKNWINSEINTSFHNNVNILTTKSPQGTAAELFRLQRNIKNLDLSGMNVSNITNMAGMFSACADNLTTLNLANWDASNVTNMYEMFYNCDVLRTLNLSNMKTLKVTNTVQMFYNCRYVSALNLANWDVSNITNMYRMFYNCRTIKTLDLATWEPVKVVDMNHMFLDCNNLTTLKLENWNMKKSINMYGMFSGCSNLTTLNLSNWNVKRTINMGSMFSGCRSLTTLNLTNWNTYMVNSMYMMFYNCNNLSSDSLNSIAEMLPKTPGNLTNITVARNNSVLGYLYIMINNTSLNSRLSSYARNIMTSKGWDLSLTRAVSADTLVNTLEGLVPVSSLNIKDKVYSYNEEKGIVEEDTINDIATEEVESTTYIIYLGEHILKANKGCEFQKVVQVGNKQELQWTSAEQLKENDNIVYTTGEIETITKIESYNETEKRYAISLENNEIYCIGAVNENAVRNRSISSKVNTSEVKLIFTKV